MAPNIEWTAENEINLLQAVCGYKPVGHNRYFNMIAILAKFCKLSSKEVDSQVLWDHLETMYNLNKLNEIDSKKFSNDEKDFDLNEDDDFMELLDKFRDKRTKENSKNSFISNTKTDIKEENVASEVTITTSLPPTPVVKVKGKPGRPSLASLESKAERGEYSTSGRKRERPDSDRSETKHTPKIRREAEDSVRSEHRLSEKNSHTPLSSSSHPYSKHHRGHDSDSKDSPITPSSGKKGSTRKANPMVKKLRGYSPAVRDTPKTSSGHKKKNSK